MMPRTENQIRKCLSLVFVDAFAIPASPAGLGKADAGSQEIEAVNAKLIRETFNHDDLDFLVKDLPSAERAKSNLANDINAPMMFDYLATLRQSIDEELSEVSLRHINVESVMSVNNDRDAVQEANKRLFDALD